MSAKKRKKPQKILQFLELLPNSDKPKEFYRDTCTALRSLAPPARAGVAVRKTSLQ